MKRIIFTLVSTLMLASCATTIDLSKIHNDTYVQCVSNIDKNHLDYLKSNRWDVPSTEFPNITISTMVDIHHKVWNINSQEWTQYTCTEKALP
jgi:PBP1b-binding outer membrane lipoprotein LpoB